jgi:HPt (histidine-containing phosphotransfer) domain-containing protein
MGLIQGATMEPSDNSDLAAALTQLWQRFMPETLARVEILEAAALACARGKLYEAQVRSAKEAAHKLAGSLGTFALTRGTVLARELEVLYSTGDTPATDLAPRLTSLAAELRHIVLSRK